MTTNIRWMKNGERGLEVLLKSTKVACFGVEGFVPFAQVVSKICEEILKVKAKFHDNNTHCDVLIQKIRDYEKVLGEIVILLPREQEKDRTQFHDFLLKVVGDFMKIIEAINERCEKWLQKTYAKQMWCASKYKDEFTMLNEKLNDCITLLSICIQLVKAENDQTAHQQSVNMHKMQVAMMSNQSSALVEDLSSTLEVFLKDFCVTFMEEYNVNASKFEIELGKSIDELKNNINASSNKQTTELMELSKEALKRQVETLDEIKKIRSEMETKVVTEVNSDQFDIIMKRMDRMADILEKKQFTDANKNWWYKLSRSSETPVLASLYEKSNVTRNAVLELEEKANISVAEIRLYVTDLRHGDSHVATIYQNKYVQSALTQFGAKGGYTAGAVALSVLGTPALIAGSMYTMYDAYKLTKCNVNICDSSTFPCLRFSPTVTMMSMSVKAIVHYHVEIVTTDGAIYTIERVAESSNPDEKDSNLRSGVLFYGGQREHKGGVTFSTNKMKNSVTLAQLKSFCEGEKTLPYSTMSNNCKHFCFKLLRNVFDEFTHLKYSSFTFWMNEIGHAYKHL